MNNKFYSIFFGCFDDGCGCHTHSHNCGGATKTVYINTLTGITGPTGATEQLS